MPEVAVKVLKRHRNRQRKERLKAGSWWNQSGLVFTSTVGTALDDRNVRKAFKAILRGAKLHTIRIHDLRHTCASLLLAQDVNPRASPWTPIPTFFLRSSKRQLGRWMQFSPRSTVRL
jgi:integrase